MGNDSVVQVVLEFDNKTGIMRVKQFEDAAVKSFRGAEAGAQKTNTSVRTLTSSYSALAVAMRAVPFLGVATAVATVVATMNKLAVGSVAAASALEETQNKFNVVFRDQLEKVETWSKQLQNNYLMSGQAAKQYLSSMQDLLKPMGMASDEAAALSYEIVKLSADLGSFNNLETAQVMGDIQSALVGNYETMKKYGTVINAGIVQEKALAMGLARTKDELTAAHKAQAAYQLILQSNPDAVGDVARSMDSYANTTKRLNAEWDDFLANLGQKTMPAATRAKNALADLFDWLNSGMETPGREKAIEMRIAQINKALALSKVRIRTPEYEERRRQIEQERQDLQLELSMLQMDRMDYGGLYGLETPKAGSGKSGGSTIGGEKDEYWARIDKEFRGKKEKDAELDYQLWLARQEEYQVEEDRFNKRFNNLNEQFNARKRQDPLLDEHTGYQTWLDDQEKQFDAMVELSERTAEAMEQNFSNLFFDVMTGEFKGMADFASGVLDSIARATSDILGQMLKTALFQKDTGLLSSIISFTPSAKGNAFYRGMVLPFALGGVVPSPSVFPLGSMAEREPEAIMPLKRGSDGRLGVETSAGQAQHTTMHITIQAVDAASFTALCARNPGAIAGAVVSELDTGNKGLRGRLRRP